MVKKEQVASYIGCQQEYLYQWETLNLVEKIILVLKVDLVDNTREGEDLGVAL